MRPPKTSLITVKTESYQKNLFFAQEIPCPLDYPLS